MTLNAASGQTYKFYLNGAGVSGGGISFLSSNISYIEPGTNGTTGRHHCAVVFNGLGGHSVYIDGRRVGESTGSGNDPFATTTLLLGGNAGNGQSTTINYYGVRVIQAALYSGPLISPPAYFVVDSPTYSTLPVKVSGIVTAECVLAGDGVYDVTGVPDSDTVIGYKIANPASARANIEPLLTLIGGYVVDEDGATKFKKFSDITSVATVSFDELGQAEGDASGEAMPLTRTQEIDLPRSVTTSYIEPTNDYQTAAETEVRQVTAATEDVQLSLAVCITSSQAKKVSQMSLYDRWRRQNTRSTSVSRKFAAVSPGDGVTIEYPRGTFKLWLVLSTNDTGAVCEWSLCPGDAAIFTQTAIGATGYTQQAVIPAPSRSQMQIVDTSILQDADNDAGTYVALASYSGTYPGGALYVGNDTTSLDLRGTVQKQCVMGWCETALPAPSVGNTVDETSLVTVNVANFTLSSTTRDVMLNNASGVNVAAIGAAGRWEIVKFYKASSLGGGRYILSGLMRGQRGTEWAMGTHQVNDTFVFLSLAGLLHPSMGVGDIGLNKVYEAVTEGLPPTSATVQTYATTGEGLKPFSPVNARWSVDASNNVTITWDRRTRLSENWLLGLVPLGETSEAYSIGFYTSSGFVTLAGTLTSTTNAVTISSAQQTVFGLTPGAKPFVRISQVSSSIGRGRELQSAF
jgi:hypothetical protein